MSEPVGPQYGLAPMQDHEIPEQRYYSTDLQNPPYLYNDPIASEFGGVPGLIQPDPHSPTASERLMMIHHIDPEDPGLGGVGSVAPPELEGNFNSEY